MIGIAIIIKTPEKTLEQDTASKKQDVVPWLFREGLILLALWITFAEVRKNDRVCESKGYIS